jgi:hypothetical protein
MPRRPFVPALFTDDLTFDRLRPLARLERNIFAIFYLEEILMSRRLSLAFLSAMFVYGLSVTFAPPALAAGAAACEISACIAYCEKRGPQAALGNYCSRNCLITIDQNKKAGKCK